MIIEKTLPIKYPPSIKSYLPISIISSITQANIGDDSWIMNHFIQLFIPEGRKKIETFPFQDFMYFDQNLFRANIMTDSNSEFSEKTFISKIIQWIDHENYVIVYADEYEIPQTRSYKRNHILHSIFIFGYNLNNQEFKILNFSNKTNNIEILYIRFEDVKNAFFSKSTIDLYKDSDITWSHKNTSHKIVLLQFTLSKNNAYVQDINIEGIWFELENYYLSKNSSIYTSFFTGKLLGTWGMSCYDKLLNMLQEKQVDYRAFHLIFEHKIQMNKRIRILSDDVELIEKYQAVIELSHKLRMYCLKYVLSKENKLIDKMIELLCDVRDIEKLNITLRRSRLSGVARATIPDKQSHLITNYCAMF